MVKFKIGSAQVDILPFSVYYNFVFSFSFKVWVGSTFC